MRYYKLIRRWFFRLLVVFIVVLLSGAVWHSWMTHRTLQRYPPPGRLVDIGGYKLHCIIEGDASPVVVIDAGQGEASYDYLHIIPKISEFSTVVCFDRPGYGWSDSIPGLRDSFREVEELRLLLEKANLSPPYILCGHSLGGLNVRLYASLYPEEVAGLVLIDALAVDVLAADAFPDDFPLGECPADFELFCIASRFGLAELCMSSMYPSVKGEPELDELRFAMKSRTSWFTTVRREYLGLSTILKARERMKHLGDIPVTVISTPGKDLPATEWWPKSQKLLTSISNNMEWIELPDCSHYVPGHRPDVIIEAVQSVVRRFKTERKVESVTLRSAE